MVYTLLLTNVFYDCSQSFTVGFVHRISGGFKDGIGKIGGMNYFGAMKIIADKRV
jgi:hypothetical protein